MRCSSDLKTLSAKVAPYLAQGQDRWLGPTPDFAAKLAHCPDVVDYRRRGARGYHVKPLADLELWRQAEQVPIAPVRCQARWRIGHPPARLTPGDLPGLDSFHKLSLFKEATVPSERRRERAEGDDTSHDGFLDQNASSPSSGVRGKWRAHESSRCCAGARQVMIEFVAASVCRDMSYLGAIGIGVMLRALLPNIAAHNCVPHRIAGGRLVSIGLPAIAAVDSPTNGGGP